MSTVILPDTIEGIGADIVAIAAFVTAVALIYRQVIRPVARWGARLEAAVSEVPKLREDIVTMTADLADQRIATKAEWERALAEFRDENTRQHEANLAAFSQRLEHIEQVVADCKPDKWDGVTERRKTPRKAST